MGVGVGVFHEERISAENINVFMYMYARALPCGNIKARWMG